MRPLKDAWFCSSSMDILDGELTSKELITAFGWKEQIDSLVIAKQLEAIEDGAADAYVKLLLIAKRRYESPFPKALYNVWPALQKRKGEKELAAVVQAHTFRSIGSGYQLDLDGMNIQVASFAQLHFPAFDIPEVLQQLDIYEDSVLIVEKLRGVLGQPLSEADCSNVELAPLRSCLPGELVAVEDDSGTLCYGKVLREQPSDIAGVSQYEVKVSGSSTRWLLATDLYFFRSARVGTSNGGSSSSSSRQPSNSERQAASLVASQSDSTALPASVVAVASESHDGAIVSGFSHTKAPSAAVSSSNVLSAVNDLLSRLNVTLDTSVEDLMAENLRLQRRLEVAEAGRRAAAAQIDAAIRERKEVQDSLVCAVCLENKVNRVLIPCGHIYCASCVEQLPRPSCPICRQNIVSSSVFHVPS
ncbi:uncharacterized protein IUM83_07145 [Phytophthora cinnamomi]|uniref:uncharacterized protein n=1 Tax=Phytophthora cinnamomi TaxID=4785 RepID=UPI003559D9A9|nr:hypothetical protein IUM83_07145 [Phytophthora cinnamomi]